MQTAVRRSLRTRPLPGVRETDTPTDRASSLYLWVKGFPMAPATLLVSPGCAGSSIASHRDKHCVAEPRMRILTNASPPANALYGVHLGGCSEGPHIIE